MKIFHRVLRYFVLSLSIAGLLIGMKACSSPNSDQTTASPPSTSISSNTSQPSSKAKGKPININSAILAELDKFEAQLGIPALSHRIQASRPYASPEELVSKKVLTQAQFDQIKEQVTIEEIVLTGEAKDVDYLIKLGLMKGHMIVAEELLALNQPKQAEPHLGHPVEEIYVDLEEQFGERKVPDFKGLLTDVQDLVKSKPNDSQVKPKFESAMTAIDQAIAALPESQRLSANITLQVMNGILETATSEYTAAITNGQIKERIEYQDSRGFVIYVKDSLLKSATPQLKQANSSATAEITAALTKLQKAWPKPIPPATPILTPDQLATQVKMIEQTSASILKASAS